MFGQSGSYIGVYAISSAASKPASLGWSIANSTGLQGYSNDGTGGTGALPAAPSNTGVYGYAAQAGGRGAQFQGKAAQVRLRPSPSSTHPSSGAAGDLFVDKSHRLWFCKGGTTWKQLA